MADRKNLIDQLRELAEETGQTVRQVALDLIKESSQKEVPTGHEVYQKYKLRDLRRFYMILHGKAPNKLNKSAMIDAIIEKRQAKPTKKVLAANLSQLDLHELRHIMLGVVPFKDRVGLLNEEDAKVLINAIIAGYRNFSFK